MLVKLCNPKIWTKKHTRGIILNTSADVERGTLWQGSKSRDIVSSQDSIFTVLVLVMMITVLVLVLSLLFWSCISRIRQFKTPATDEMHHLRLNVITSWLTCSDFVTRLDEFWSNQDCKYLWKANLSGTGNRSGVLCNYD